MCFGLRVYPCVVKPLNGGGGSKLSKAGKAKDHIGWVVFCLS